MNLEISLVPHGILYRALPDLIPYLEKSAAWTRGRASIDDILEFLYSKKMQLWLTYDTETYKGYGYVITEVKTYPRCKMLVAQYCAGESNHMQYVEDKMYELLERFAKETGCAGIEFFGRPGWGAHSKKRGYTVQTVVYEKYFGDEVQQ